MVALALVEVAEEDEKDGKKEEDGDAGELAVRHRLSPLAPSLAPLP